MNSLIENSNRASSVYRDQRRDGVPGSGILAIPGFFQKFIQVVKYCFHLYIMKLQRHLRSEAVQSGTLVGLQFFGN